MEVSKLFVEKFYLVRYPVDSYFNTYKQRVPNILLFLIITPV